LFFCEKHISELAAVCQSQPMFHSYTVPYNYNERLPYTIFQSDRNENADVHFLRMLCGRKSLKKRMDVFWRSDIRQEVNFFLVLKVPIIRLFRVIFIQSFTLDARNAFCENVRTCRHLFRYGKFFPSIFSTVTLFRLNN
jgi:hypothetical protein